MPFASPSAMAALGEVKAAWGLERWKSLDAATKTKLWNARRAGEDGWTPPDFTPAVTPSPPRDEDSSSGEEEVVESGAVATPDKDDDGLSGMLSSLSVAAPAAASREAAVPTREASKSAALPPGGTKIPSKGNDVDALDAALASINLGPQTPQKKPAAGGPAWDSLRRYQRALVLDVEDRMKSPRARTAARPFASVLLSLATGGGKTRVAAAFLERNCLGEAALFVVNRTVLSIQAQDALRDYCAVVEWDRDLTIKPLADDRPTVYVATIQGLRASGALQKPLDGVACVVIDEAHHGAADSYLSLLFAGLKSNASAKVLGLTATPFRLARDAVLGSAFSSAARGPTVQELVRSGVSAAPSAATAHGWTPSTRRHAGCHQGAGAPKTNRVDGAGSRGSPGPRRGRDRGELGQTALAAGAASGREDGCGVLSRHPAVAAARRRPERRRRARYAPRREHV